MTTMSELLMRLHFLSLPLLCCISPSSSIIIKFFTSDPVVGLVGCHPHQTKVFTQFKNEFYIRRCNHNNYNGIWCDNSTGAVTKLRLRACLSGTLKSNSSLFHFHHLRFLDLSHNKLASSSLPSEFGNLNKLECIAHHRETRGYFLKAKMPHYFFPLTDIDLVDKPLECIRLGALGVIAHMLKAPVDGAAVRFLVGTGALECCIKAIEIGSTESKTIAVFILNKIMSTDEGLQYCCVLADRFFIIIGLLKKLVAYLSLMAKPSPSLFNLVVGCYAKLSQKFRARDALNRYLPVTLVNGTFVRLLAEDPVAANYHDQLTQNLGIKRTM